MAEKAVPPNPSGLCGCGCGQRTEIADHNLKLRGWVKGYPKRFINGHQSRKPGKLYEVRDLGYETPCWVWLRYRNPKGYGMMREPGQKNMQLSHRVFFRRAGGKIPKGYKLHHKCEQGHEGCVRPDHCEPMQQTPHRRVHAPKLTMEDARLIRAIYDTGEITQIAVAQMFGISKALVSFVVTNKAWREAEECKCPHCGATVELGGING